MAFSPLTLKEQLSGLDGVSRLVIALSGGLDSCVLLHSIIALRDHALREQQIFPFTIEALHVNHGLSPNAEAWERFCTRLSRSLGIPLQVVHVQIDASAGASLENLARIKRYEAFELSLGSEDCLLMGHHLDDQAETFALRALRGSGPKGLASIPRRRPIGHAMILRPMLDIPRQQLSEFAVAEGLDWVEDESNERLDFDRNYLRHHVLPQIDARWPGFAANWARSAALCAEANKLIEEIAAQDLDACRGESLTSLSIESILSLSQSRQRNLIRYWVQVLDLAQPGWNTLTQIVDSLLPAKEDAQAKVSWVHQDGRIELRRFQGQLLLQQSLEPLDTTMEVQWDLQADLTLGANGVLRCQPSVGEGVSLPAGSVLTVRYRQGGEKLRLPNRPNRPLKKILQEAAMPPWWRERVPLLYLDDELVCVPGIGIAQAWKADATQDSIEFSWQAPSALPMA
ncbi:MAG: tRNA lysidine(34) synthetase TilS [Pseudohongiellaceae bacterium]|nr:tRNA lysidine(34) synthetase TilS [Pseudohongiellaceae bacterium]